MAGEDGKTLDLGPYLADISQPLGSGTFGEVFLGRDRETAEKVAIKKIQYRSEGDYKNLFMAKMAETEIQHAMTLNGHPNIVSFLDYYNDGASFWLTMEYCPCGDLDEYLLENHGIIDMNAKVKIMYQCVRGIAFMHSFEPSFVHRDIKPKNFLVTVDSPDEVTVKASDFGVAKLLEKSHKEHGTSSYGASILMNSFVGSPSFMAPEMFEDNEELHYTSAVDIFSLGLLLQVLLMFSSDNKVMVPQLDGLKMKVYTVGQMYKNAMDNGSDIPELVHDHPDDSTVVKKLKMIIRSMTSSTPKDRPKLWIVENDLESTMELLDKDHSSKDSEVGGKNASSCKGGSIIDEETLATVIRTFSEMNEERQQRADPPPKRNNNKPGKPPARRDLVTKPRRAPKPDDIDGAVEPVAAMGHDSVDQMLSSKPKIGHVKLIADKLQGFENISNVRSATRDRERGGVQLTEEERQDMFQVSNINDFKRLEDIKAKFTHAQD